MLAAILCNAPPLIFQPPLLIIIAQSLSLVYLCVQFVFTAAPLHFLVRWISRLIAPWSKGVYIPPCISFVRTTLNLDQFFLVLWQMKTSFSQRSWDPIRLKIIAVVNEGSKVLDISTRTLVGLPDLASDGSPLFAEPTVFLFGWTLCNTSTYWMLNFWLSCVNYALRGEFPLLHAIDS